MISDARLPDHPLIYVNAAFETITGYSRSDVLGRNCRFLQGGATDRETVAEIRAALDAGEECTRVVLNFRKDGGPFWNELRISPVHDKAGVLTHFIGIQHVTERLTAKLEAERLSDYNKLLLESTGNGVYAMDTTGVCLYINRAGARMLGYEPDEVLGLHAHQLFHHSHADGSPYPAADCPIYRAFLIGKGCRVEDEVFWHQNGVPVPVEYSSFPLLERDNEIRGAVVIFADITERKKAEAEIQAAYQATEAATRAKSAFLSNMSHELRTPLNAVIGYAELAEEKAAEEGAAALVSDLGKIRVAGHHLLSLINQVLDLSKVEAGRMEIEVSEFSLAGLAADVITTVKPMADQRGDSLAVSVPDRGGLCRGDFGKLTQTLLNVLSNAIKFTSNGLIEVSLRLPSHGWLEIEVTDSGIGMTAEQLSRVFEPFSQADPSTTRRYGGTGLGLAICRSFCRLMGGDIDATSVLGAGSKFVIRVPVEVVEAPGPSPDRNDSEEKPDVFTANTVLVIDDDPDARELMVRNLEPAGYEVRTADGMAAGMALARELRPIVILVDLLMPKGSGWEVLSRLKAEPKLATIPVVVVTVVNQRPRGKSFGAAEHVTKPVDWKKLLKIVGRYRRDARRVNLPTIKPGDVHE